MPTWSFFANAAIYEDCALLRKRGKIVEVFPVDKALFKDSLLTRRRADLEPSEIPSRGFDSSRVARDLSTKRAKIKCRGTDDANGRC